MSAGYNARTELMQADLQPNGPRCSTWGNDSVRWAGYALSLLLEHLGVSLQASERNNFLSDEKLLNGTIAAARRPTPLQPTAATSDVCSEAQAGPRSPSERRELLGEIARGLNSISEKLPQFITISRDS
ncbi:hypothetical protein QTP88_021414 [Uroleucon formosanum]